MFGENRFKKSNLILIKGSEIIPNIPDIITDFTKDIPKNSQKEKGITTTVTTYYSSITIWDIIRIITGKKSDSVLEWINSLPVDVKNPVITGAYLTGASMAQKLTQSPKIKQAQVLDIYPHLDQLLDVSWDFKDEGIIKTKDKKISFSTDLKKHLKTGDMVIDTTGLGGIEQENIKELKRCKVFLVEDPSSDGSDSLIQRKNLTSSRLEASSAQHKARLFTSGLGSKTSGTMTLTLDVLNKSLNEVLKKEGVLYAVASLDFYERILFKEKDTEKFLKTIQRPAMVASSLKSVDLDRILIKYVEKIAVTILEE